MSGPAQGRFGLEGIRERVDQASGRMTVWSAPDRGIEIQFELTLEDVTTMMAAVVFLILLQSQSAAGLRSVRAVNEHIAWAGGTGGTILRTVDGGAHWKRCRTPPGGEQLDFRGLQAFDGNTALAMASGPGALSRVYRTTDGGQSWTLAFGNPDAPAGFFDVLDNGVLLGDPVRGVFAWFRTGDQGITWNRAPAQITALEGESLFAASNSLLLGSKDGSVRFVTGGRVSRIVNAGGSKQLPLRHRAPSQGAFSIAAHGLTLVAVGGDYSRPDDQTGTSAYSSDDGATWSPSSRPPRGYRSSVVYEPVSGIWLTAGPNGIDVSRDQGSTWTAVTVPDAYHSWNAIAFPYVVGARGAIGRLIIEP